MLKSLVINNYVLIDELDIRFDAGFSVITGETGAGKSILLGALGLALGERADTKSIRTGSDKCVIEALFDVSDYHLEQFFADNDLEYEGGECLLRRELTAAGKSRAFINDTPAPLSIVKELGAKLLDIHSQHQNLLLADARFQLRVVDLIAHNQTALTAYRALYDKHAALKREYDELKTKAKATLDEQSSLTAQCDELKSAQLKADEQSALEEEMETLSHTEEIKTGLHRMTENIDAESNSAVTRLRDAIAALKPIVAVYPRAAEYSERLQSALIDVADLAREATIVKDDIEFIPERLEYVNHRLSTLYSLQKRYRVTSVAELIALRDNMQRRIDEIETFDEQLSALQQRCNEAYDALITQADALTAIRKKSAIYIEEQLTERLTLLGIPNARFQIDFARRAQPSMDGIDEINFLFTANRNEALRPVAQTASGGEISRLMLCIKAMIAGYAALPSIIFDEIDAGVSGEIADKMAGIMQELGASMQVITITHLPQIAARGKAQYYVYKEDSADERTRTVIRRLEAAERVAEIARMLSGATVSQAAIDNAKALLKN